MCTNGFTSIKSLLSFGMKSSVRGMLKKASANKNSKIPNTRFHKLQYNTFRIKFQRLELLPFNFEIPVIFTQLLVVFSRAILKSESRMLLLRLEIRKNSFSVILLSGKKQQHILQIVINLQSDQLKTRKFYKYFSENADFSKLSGKGQKTKGQILKHSNDSLWNELSGILLFYVIFNGFTRPRTLIRQVHFQSFINP